jgi:hypothetical protein
MILSYSHNNIFTEQGFKPTEHKPYFLVEDNQEMVPHIKEIQDVVDVSAPFQMKSWVDWSGTKTVRRVYVTKPAVTPRVSTDVYELLGLETYEQSVPYKSRVYADMEANGNWPLTGDWTTIHGLIYDIENIEEKDLISCIGLGEFDFRVRGAVDLQKEKFDFDVELPTRLKVTQLLCDDRRDHLDNIFRPFVKHVENAHMIIGHNVAAYDNPSVLDQIKEYAEFEKFIRTKTYEHEGFQRGRRDKRVVEFYPITFDTLTAARFIWRGESDIGYGLKELARKFNTPVYECDASGYTIPDKPTKRIYQRDFLGFGNWSNENPLCLQYNNHDIQETFGLFNLQARAILINMFVSGLSFEDVVSGSNGRLADHLCLVRGYNKEINPPMMHPFKVAKALQGHFNGVLKTKKEMFDFFRHHRCNWDCLAKFQVEEGDDEEEVYEENDTPQRLYDKLVRVIKYGNEMPDYLTYYPFLCSPYSKKEQKKDPKKRPYIAVGGLTIDPTEPLFPVHNAMKGDTAAQYPTILKAKNIVSDSVKLSRKGDKIDGWCWFRHIYNKEILSLFEWRPATDFPYSDGEGYFIGYYNRGTEGLLNSALTGIIGTVGVYKKKEGWNEAYQKTLKPMRNALTHGVLLAGDATCEQYNIAGCAIPTTGQEITYQMNNLLAEHDWKLLESDTDGTEFRRLTPSENPKDDIRIFDELITQVEKHWSEKLKFPVAFDREHSDHKLFIAHKNYITIEKGKIKLTGNTLHSREKPKVAVKAMEELMLRVLPNTNNKEDFLSSIHEVAAPIVNNVMKNATPKDLVMISSVKSPDMTEDAQYRERAEAIEELIGREIGSYAVSLEYVVCDERLPGCTGEKTLSRPIAYMWPIDLVESRNLHIDLAWYKKMIFSYIDTAFSLFDVSSAHQVQSLYNYSGEEDETRASKKKKSGLEEYEDNVQNKTETKTNSQKQGRLF